MSRFDDATRAVADFAGAAEKKGEELYKTSKLKIKESQKKSAVNKKYAELGRIYYKSVKSGQDFNPQAEAVIEEIDWLIREIENIRDEQTVVKGAVRCCSCGSVNKDSSVYCSKCGEKL